MTIILGTEMMIRASTVIEIVTDGTRNSAALIVHGYTKEIRHVTGVTLWTYKRIKNEDIHIRQDNRC